MFVFGGGSPDRNSPNPTGAVLVLCTTTTTTNSFPSFLTPPRHGCTSSRRRRRNLFPPRYALETDAGRSARDDDVHIGLLFTHWIADSLTLWQSPLTDEHLRTAATYYASFASLPLSMVVALVVVTTVGAVSLLASFQDGEAGNVMFDGASICTYPPPT